MAETKTCPFHGYYFMEALNALVDKRASYCPFAPTQEGFRARDPTIGSICEMEVPGEIPEKIGCPKINTSEALIKSMKAIKADIQRISIYPRENTRPDKSISRRNFIDWYWDVTKENLELNPIAPANYNK